MGCAGARNAYGGLPNSSAVMSRGSANQGHLQHSRAWLDRFDAHLHLVAWREFLTAHRHIDLLHHLRARSGNCVWKRSSTIPVNTSPRRSPRYAQEPVSSPIVFDHASPAERGFNLRQNRLEPFVVARFAVLQIRMKQLPV